MCVEAVDDTVADDEVDPDIIIHVIRLAWCSKFKTCKALKKEQRRINTYSVAS